MGRSARLRAARFSRTRQSTEHGLVLTDESVLVPPGRLAALLSSRRKALGLDLAQMASRSEGRFSPLVLSDLERGRIALDDDALRDLTELYELDSGPVVPARSRLIVDLGGGEMRVGSTGVAIEGNELDSILERYLSLLYLLRNLKPGTPLTLRDPDVEALSEALEASIAEVEQRLGTLMLGASVEDRSRLLSKRLMVPGAGLLVGITAVGALIIVGGNSADAGKLSTPSLANAAASMPADDSVTSLRSNSSSISDAGNGASQRLILPSGVTAEVVDRSDGGASDASGAAVGAEAQLVAEVEAPVENDAAVGAPAASAPDRPSVAALAAADNAVPQVPEAVVDASPQGAVDSPAPETSAPEAAPAPEAEAPVAEPAPEAEAPVAEPALEAEAPVAESNAADAVVDDAVDAVVEATNVVEAESAPARPVAPVEVPAIVIPQAADHAGSIEVVVPDEPAPPPAAVAVELADAVQVQAPAPAVADAPNAGESQFNVESSELAGPGFIINEAPDDDLYVPPPAPPPVEITAAPLVVVPAGPYSQIGAEAEALIQYDFRAQLPEWSFRYEGDTPGYRGLTNLPTKTISVYVNTGDTAYDVAEILAHEIGHAIDVTYFSDDDRYAWLDARAMPAAWWPGDGLSDFHVGAGDWAEGVAAYLVGSPSYSAYGGFTPGQLELVGELLPR